MDGEGSGPSQELNGREALTPVFADLNRYDATTHFNGQSTIALDGDRATGESYCLAHHLFVEDGERKLMLASLRYLETRPQRADTSRDALVEHAHPDAVPNGRRVIDPFRRERGPGRSRAVAEPLA